MAAQLKEIVDRLNAEPFNLDLSLLVFDEKDHKEIYIYIYIRICMYIMYYIFIDKLLQLYIYYCFWFAFFQF